MRTLSNKIFLSVITIAILGVSAYTYAGTDSIRQPVWAGKFYPARPAALRKVLDDFTELARSTQVAVPRDKSLKAILLPHAGYVYSGWTAAHAVHVLKSDAFDNVIVMAPDHRVGFSGGAISDAAAYQTPLGVIRIHPAAADLRRRYDFFSANRTSDEQEHAVEVVLPVLQYFLGGFALIPMVLGPCRTEVLAEAVIPLLDRRTLLVVSSDLSHYLPYDQAVVRDRRTIETIMALDRDTLVAQENVACGKQAILILLYIAKQLDWTPVFLHYANSGDTAGSHDRVVGYAAIAFYGNASGARAAEGFTDGQGRLLVRVARSMIEGRLLKDTNRLDPAATAKLAQAPAFQQRCGTFVTLKRNNQLRGCIGNLTGDRSVLEGIKHNAVQAAFHDPRFPPLTLDELKDLDVEVSILTRPKPLPYQNSQDLISKLRIHVDGVIIRKGSAAATFLPQVWQQLPQPELFMGRLCLKAGLSPDAWQRTPLEVMTYQVQHFHEKN